MLLLAFALCKICMSTPRTPACFQIILRPASLPQTAEEGRHLFWETSPSYYLCNITQGSWASLHRELPGQPAGRRTEQTLRSWNTLRLKGRERRWEANGEEAYLSTAMATSVKTEAETDIPWIRLLIVQVNWLKGQPVIKIRTLLTVVDATPEFKCRHTQQSSYSCSL